MMKHSHIPRCFLALTLICCMLFATACGGETTASSNPSDLSSTETDSAIMKTESKKPEGSSSKNNSSKKKTSSGKKNAKKSTTTANQKEEELVLSNLEKIIYGVDPDLYPTPLVNQGNSARIANLMKKAASGGKYTIAVLGGSISQGAGSNGGQSYGSLVCKWWQENFPNAEFTFVNAGLGATNPQMACYRVYTDLLQYKPDFVVIDFTVNTWLDNDLYTTYSTLLNRILSLNAAVMGIHFTNCDRARYDAGVIKQGLAQPDGQITAALKEYQIPTVSYHDFVWKKINAKTLSWNEIGADYIHPNSNGHQIASMLITKHLEYVKKNVSSLAKAPSAVPALHRTDYLKASNLTVASNGVKVTGNFEKLSNQSTATRGWHYAAGAAGTLEFETPKNSTVYLLMSFEANSSGNVTVTANDGSVQNISPSAAATPTLVPIGSGKTKYTVSPALSNGGFTIYGVCLN